MPRHETRRWDDIQYMATMTEGTNEFYANFIVYDLHGQPSRFLPDGTRTAREPDRTHPFLSGFVRCDGCMNMRFDDQERHMLHVCDVTQAQEYGVLLRRLYVLAAEVMAEHAQDIMGPGYYVEED